VSKGRNLDERPAVRLTFCEGELDVMVTSAEHERIKILLGRLLEMYAVERGVDLNGYGSTTFRKRAKQRGLEPDECYVLGTTLVEVPDLAIAIALTSGYVDKLDVYAGLAIPEVWFWRDGRIEVWRLAPGGGSYDRVRPWITSTD
jgi:Uma2 family endonuclease